MASPLPPADARAQDTDAIVEPRRVLETVVTDLELLRDEHPTAVGNGLIELHGALLLYALDGRAELVPSVGFPVPGRRFLEFRVAAAARRLAGRARGEEAAAQALLVAEGRIEDLLHLIDPDLRAAA